MSWLYSRALVVEYLAANSLDGEPFVQSNGKPTPLAFCAPDRMKAHSRLSRYGVTFAPLTEDLGVDLLKWYQAGFPVRTYPSREKEMDSMESGAQCGTKWRGWLAKFDPNSSSWKTPQCSLFEEESGLLQTLPRWGMTAHGLLWEQPMLAHHTNATESGYLLPTPTASMMPCEGTVRIMRKHWEAGKYTLEEASAIAGRDIRKSQGKLKTWPTPTVGCVEGGEQSGRVEETPMGGYVLRKLNKPNMTYGAKLSDAILYEEKKKNKDTGGKLNPTWTEWLMGWPLGWTDLKELEMDKSPYVQQPLGES